MINTGRLVTEWSGKSVFSIREIYAGQFSRLPMGINTSLLEAKEEKGRNVDDKSSSSGADWRQPGPNRRRKIDPEANAAAPLDAWSSA